MTVRFTFIMFIALFTHYLAVSQGNQFNFTGIVNPNNLGICSEPKTFSVTITNISTTNYTNVSFTVDLPDGINYVSGTVTNASEFDISNLNVPIFSIANFPAGTSITVTYQGTALCAVNNLIINDLDINVKYRVDYTGNYDEITSDEFNVFVPALSFQSIVNQTFTGNVGQTFTRTITIKNTGNSPLSAFTLTDTFGTGITVINMSPGTFGVTGNVASIALGAAQFVTVGNNDGFLDPNEQIVITETIQILACSNLTSEYGAIWGCNSQNCAITQATGNVVIGSGNPNLVFTVTNNNINTCYTTGGVSTRQLRIQNTGTTPARDVFLSFYQSGTNLYSYFDASSFNYTVNGGAPIAITPTAVTNQNKTGAAAACLGVPNNTPLPQAVDFEIPIIQPGDIVFINFDTRACCPNTACNPNSANAFSWTYSGNYKDQCLSNNFTISTNVVRSNSNTGSPTTNVSGPASVPPSGTGTFCLSFPSGWNQWPTSAGGIFRFNINLPPDFSYTGNPADITFVRGTSSWTPSSINVSGSVLTIEFTLPNPLGGTNNAELCIKLNNSCGTGGSKTLTWNMEYVPNNSCACNSKLLCTRTFSFSSTCPIPCATGGTSMYDFSMYRTNLGLPDANDDGLPDAGPHNMSVVKLDRAMVGDTVRQTVKAAFLSGTGGTDWSFAYFRTTINNANTINLTNIARSITIYDVSAMTSYTCTPNLVSMTVSGAGRIYLFSFNVDDLISAGCLPPGFKYENGDSIVLNLDYRVNNNIGNSITSSTVTNQMYASNVALMTHPGGYSCFNINGVYNWVGYSFTNDGTDYITVSGCNDATSSQSFNFRLGNTSNAFPGEFRNFAKIKQVTAVIPTGYSFVSAEWRQNRSNGAGNTTVSQAFLPVLPVNPLSSTLVFNNLDLEYPPIGSYQLSDDNFNILFRLTIRPSCAVTPNTYLPIAYTARFDTSAQLGTSTTSVLTATVRDSILHVQPILNVQSSLPSIIAERDTVEWTVIISNIGTVATSNTWFSPVNTSGKISIFEVEDVTGVPFVITPVNNIYAINNIGAGGARTFKIKAKYTNCNKDSITVHAGWNCTSVPSNLSAYSPCVTSQLKLYLQAIKPVFTAAIDGPMAPVNLCDTIVYTVTFTNTSDGRAYQPFVQVRRSNLGIVYVPNSAEIMYPDGGTWETFVEPTPLGSSYVWNVSDKYPEFSTLGLRPATQSPQNIFKIRFKMVTNCNFVSGSYLRFRISAKGGCGTFYNYNFNSQVVTIAGAPTNYTTSISTQIDTVRNCGVPITYRVKIVNLGSGTTNSTDRFQIDLPEDFTYVMGSTTDIYQGFTNNPNISMIGTEQRLWWEITGGVAPGDSIVFSFQAMPTNSLTTGDYANDIETQLRVVLSCGASTCTISNINGTLTKNTRVERPSGVWTGFVDTDWFNVYNWADCELPTCSKDVTIPDVTNKPIVSTAQQANTQSLFILSNSSVTLNPSARINICGDLDVASNANFISGNNSEVHFTGSTDQTINLDGSANFERVYAEQVVPSFITLNHHLNIAKTLTLTSGIFVTGANQVFVQSGLANSVNAGNASSYVQGYLRRNVSETGIFYLPVGNASKGYELAEVRLNNRADLNQLYSYFNNWPGMPYILNQPDCNGVLDQPALNHGFWTIDATFASGTPSPVDYNLYLHNSNYTNPLAGWAIMKKPTGSPETNFNILDGVCTLNPTPTLTRRFSMTSFSDFAVAQSATILPVELLSLNASAFHNQAIRVYWSTQTESHNAGFEVQKSMDGINFTPIQFVAGAVYSTQRKDYQHIDDDVQPKTKYYYRLKQVDLDGNYLYSNVVEATLTPNENIITVYPNPAKQTVNIVSEKPWGGKVHVKLYNLLGELLIEDFFENQVTLSLQGLADGQYLVKIESPNVQEAVKVTVMK